MNIIIEDLNWRYAVKKFDTTKKLWSDLSILVVDDNKINLKLAEVLLTKNGATVTSAPSGDNAIDYAKDNDFDLIFMDVRMPPGWDGIETIKRIWEKWPHIEMVICTAYSDYSWEKILQKVGTTDQLMFLRKPFDVISVKQMALALTKKWNLGKRARQYVGDLEQAVADRTKKLNNKVNELQKAMDEIQILQGIIPMCMYCNKIRDDENFWQRVDHYIQGHTVANISHSVCPQCYDSAMTSMLKEIKDEDEE